MASRRESSHPPVSAAVRIGVAGHDHALASWGNVQVVIWRHVTTLAGVRALRQACTDFGARNPEGVLLLTIIHAGAPAPLPRVRAELARFLGESSQIRASAVVMEGSGFRAAFVRGVVTGLTLLARQPFPHEVCTLEGARDLFERSTRGTRLRFDAPAFVPGITALRARIEQQIAAEPAAF